MEKESDRKKLVVTDTVFSMDGDLAPLAGICKICRESGALLYIDDAHGTGVLGKGRGALSHFQIRPEPWIIQMGTFSKALGSYGAFVAGSSDLILWLLNTARSFMFSTALPACIAAGSLAALELVENRPEIIKTLWKNRERLVSGLSGSGFRYNVQPDTHNPDKTRLSGRCTSNLGESFQTGHLRARHKAADCKRTEDKNNCNCRAY